MPEAQATQAQLARSRESRLGWLRAARLIAWLAVFWVAWWQRDVVTGFKAWGWNAIGSRVGVSSGGAAFPGWSETWHMVSIAVPWLLYTGVITAAWNSWGDAELRRTLNAQRVPTSRAWLWSFAVLIAALPSIASALAVPATLMQFVTGWVVGSVLAGSVMQVLHDKRLTTAASDR